MTVENDGRDSGDIGGLTKGKESGVGAGRLLGKEGDGMVGD